MIRQWPASAANRFTPLAVCRAASMAFLRFTHGPVGAGLLLAASLAVWTVVPIALAARRLGRNDL